MKVQVLCATMHQKDFSKISEMNIKTDVVFANQADSVSYTEQRKNGFCAQMITTATRGVGINRNIALMSADADVCLIADDDMRYVDNYAEIVEKAFSALPDADAIIFNIDTIGADFGRRKNTKIKRLHFYNCLNYGAARIALKNNVLKRENIYFSRLFGGGTIYSCGEDSIFIWNLIKKGFRLYAYPVKIAEVKQDTSTWFKGYNKKYLYDKGALFAALSKKFARAFCLQELARHKNIYKEAGVSFFEAYRLMKDGIRGYKELREYKE